MLSKWSIALAVAATSATWANPDTQGHAKVSALRERFESHQSPEETWQKQEAQFKKLMDEYKKYLKMAEEALKQFEANKFIR